ncbi:MAG TPA: hypothetical protein PLS39_14720 [Accumulibacter sp.]|nr:hypothetical protein [Accumulibacter sp.]HMX22907.1 hypothetical protein [Accumulibacter sp.]HND81641.1 hypothetical protein [Accumulibacter sp.]HNL15228.1 hypothetical protein [Accumulibacter sp.]HNO56453.1 hypothetical protein [Accumulibacter sp.]
MTFSVAAPDIEGNWFSLIEAIKAGKVIPVIGPDLLEIERDDADGAGLSERLDVLIAEDLSRRFGLPLGDSRDQAWVLHDYVASLISHKQLNPDRIRRAVASVLTTLTRACEIPKPLAQAAIDDFKLFVSLSSATTCCSARCKASMPAPKHTPTASVPRPMAATWTCPTDGPARSATSCWARRPTCSTSRSTKATSSNTCTGSSPSTRGGCATCWRRCATAICC